MRQAAESPTTSDANAEVDAPAPQAAPDHVAIIMDGNGRWAEGQGLSRAEGHRAGVENIRRILRRFAGAGVKYVTLFGFSTENWERPDDEVQALISLLGRAIQEETEPLHLEGVRVRHVGRQNRLPPDLQNAIRQSVELTKDNESLTLSVAFDYGGRADILDAIRGIVADGVAPEQINEDLFQRYLYTSGLPDPDLIIRTAGEMRLSNFLLWQSAYAEYYSTLVLWPDFDEAEVDRALAAYSRRQRRYGRLGGGDPT